MKENTTLRITCSCCVQYSAQSSKYGTLAGKLNTSTVRALSILNRNEPLGMVGKGCKNSNGFPSLRSFFLLLRPPSHPNKYVELMLLKIIITRNRTHAPSSYDAVLMRLVPYVFLQTLFISGEKQTVRSRYTACTHSKTVLVADKLYLNENE